jgi:hypothetical protein
VRHGRGTADEPDGGDEQPGYGAADRQLRADAQSDDGVRRGGEPDVGAGAVSERGLGIPGCPRRIPKDLDGCSIGGRR